MHETVSNDQQTFKPWQRGFPPEVGATRLLTAPEPFSETARQPPPFPSSANYDAKAWQFVMRHASPGALFWNVGA